MNFLQKNAQYEVHWISLFAGVLLIIAIIFLGTGGPFFSPTDISALRPVLSRFVAGDGRLATIVGSPDPHDAAFRSSQKNGVLSFGPYISLQPGRYAVSWIGSVRRPSHAVFDIFSANQGIIKKSMPELAVAADVHTLERLNFSITRPLENVEFRVLVGEKDDLSINSVELWTLKQ